jgi:hypothetical protein
MLSVSAASDGAQYRLDHCQELRVCLLPLLFQKDWVLMLGEETLEITGSLSFYKLEKLGHNFVKN